MEANEHYLRQVE